MCGAGVSGIVSVHSPPSSSLSVRSVPTRATQAQRRRQSPLLLPVTLAERMAGGEESAMTDGRTLPSAADTAISSPTWHFVGPAITLSSVQTSGVLARSS